MIQPRRNLQAGFSAVELLITLFIAAAFIATGYQLYSLVIKDGGDARARTRASNIAYDNLRRYSGQVTNPCVAATPSATIPAGSNLSSASITVTISCPYGAINISKVLVSITYGSPQQEVVHGIYVTK